MRAVPSQMRAGTSRPVRHGRLNRLLDFLQIHGAEDEPPAFHILSVDISHQALFARARKVRAR